MRVSFVQLEEDVFWYVQNDGDPLKTNGSGFNRITNKYGNLVVCYVDGIVISTPTLTDHVGRPDEVFECLKRIGLKCKPPKGEILMDSINYLGRKVDMHGVRPEPDAAEAVLTWKASRANTQQMGFLGFANFYGELLMRNKGKIKGCADKVYPMQQLMRKKGKKFE